MPASEDLNTNLIKSLTSVHLPPPPASHQLPLPLELEIQEIQQKQIQEIQKLNQQHAPLQRALTNKTAPKSTSAIEPMPLTKSKHLSATTEEISLPLTTPPHTVTRGESTVRSESTKAMQETPTVPQGRAKRSSKDPLSPQYSSPSLGQAAERASAVKKDLKPPQPSFVTPKTSKKQQQRGKQLKEQQERESFELPSPRRMPKVIYNSSQKPPYSYAILIGMAILRGDGRKLTLSQIYNWISSTFRYYRMEDVGWQNSIRHNLSLNKAFIKTEKSSDGKGHYWEVAKGHELQFIKNKNRKKAFGIQLEHPKKDELRLVEPAPLSSDISKKKKRSHSGSSTSEESPSSSSSSEDNDYEYKPQTQTPKAQIRSTETRMVSRVPLKKSNSAIGLQRYFLPSVTYSGATDDELEEEEEEEGTKIPRKKQQLRTVSTGNGQLKNIPSLEAPETNWAASALGERIIFGQVKSDSPRERLVNLPLTSSFSCNTNFELSPLKRQETGPLLEPLTPSSRLSTFSTNFTIPTSQTSSMRTPLRHTTAGTPKSLLNTAQNAHVLQFLRTPTTKIRTPSGASNSILRKFWHSPSVMDDFYTSPSIPRNSDDSYHESLFWGSPERQPRRQLFQETSGTYDLFGIDICSVVKRAVEDRDSNGVCAAGSRLDSVMEREGSTTDEDVEQ